ncbi:MAG: hypothetical protein R3C53_18755 [Pirellulaceae bacterium]
MIHEHLPETLPNPVAMPLTDPLIVAVTGADAAKVLNNLTTNDIAKLPLGEQLETFVTDLRGWVVAHGLVRKYADRVILVGQHPQPTVVCAHIDRYIIREDAVVHDLSNSHQLLLVDNRATANAGAPEDDAELPLFNAPIVSPTSQIQIAESSSQPVTSGSTWAAEFTLRRIQNFWPRMGLDIQDKCIPQELDRDRQAISFVKGCYLGQETIARLDARGQLQKKLCLMHFQGRDISIGDEIFQVDDDDAAKAIGRITSAALDSHEDTYALGYLRRGNFEAGTAVMCGGIAGQVMNPAQRRE